MYALESPFRKFVKQESKALTPFFCFLSYVFFFAKGCSSILVIFAYTRNLVCKEASLTYPFDAMSSEPKNISQTSDFEIDSEDVRLPPQTHVLRSVDAARVSLTALALLAGITILGVSADALAVYDATHVPANYLLPLWPDAFDLRPTVALVVGSSIVVVANLVSLLFSRVQSVS